MFPPSRGNRWKPHPVWGPFIKKGPSTVHIPFFKRMLCNGDSNEVVLWWYNFVIFFSKWKFFVEESFGWKFLWYQIPGLGFLRKFRKKIKNQVWNILWQIFESYKLYSEIQDRVIYDNLSLISLHNNLSLIKLILKSWI